MWLQFRCLFFQNVRHSNLVSKSCYNCCMPNFLFSWICFLGLEYSDTQAQEYILCALHRQKYVCERVIYNILSLIQVDNGIIYAFSKEFGDGCRSLTMHLRKIETTIKQICTCKMSQKQRWEIDISRKDASQLPASLIKVSFIQNGFSDTFCWSKSLSGAFHTNPVDTRPRFNVDTTMLKRSRVSTRNGLIISGF